MPSQNQAYSDDKANSPKRPPQPSVGDFDKRTPQPTSPEALIQQAGSDPKSLTPREMVQLQRVIGNRALGKLLPEKIQRQDEVSHKNKPGLPDHLKASPEYSSASTAEVAFSSHAPLTSTYSLRPTPSGPPMIQRTLSKTEKDDKLRLLKDYVQFTPPQLFADEHGTPPKDTVAYRKALLTKIRGTTNAANSLKAKGDMRADVEDDDWEDNSFNDKTLESAIDAIYTKSLKPKDSSRKIGRTDAEFDKHDCVWAAVTYALGFPDSLDVEKRLAAAFSSQEGEVEDSILYRIMEELGWSFQGQGSFARMFPQPPGIGTASTANVKGFYDGRYIISEDKNAGGTQGHVLAVDVKDVDDRTNELGFHRQITLTDRQYHRQNRVDRQNQPQFMVYVWKVQGDNSGLAGKIR